MFFNDGMLGNGIQKPLWMNHKGEKEKRTILHLKVYRIVNSFFILLCFSSLEMVVKPLIISLRQRIAVDNDLPLSICQIEEQLQTKTSKIGTKNPIWIDVNLFFLTHIH